MWQLIPVRDSDGQPCIGILAHAVKVIHTLPADQGALADAPAFCAITSDMPRPLRAHARGGCAWNP